MPATLHPEPTPATAPDVLVKHQIKHWYTNALLFECELPANTPSGMAVRLALEQATAIRADLRGADLRSADLSDANLRGADLSDAYLRGANLSDANLSDADLSGANLRGADLRGADLSDAYLRGADLSGADLRGADLSDANLSGADLSDAYLRSADLSDANLSGANLSDAYLRGAKNDFWAVLLYAPREISDLRAALISGKVNGSVYEGSCACLIGSIAKSRGVNYGDLGNGLAPQASRPAERWFLAIKTGDTPETNQISRITVEWLDEFVALMNAAQVAA